VTGDADDVGVADMTNGFAFKPKKRHDSFSAQICGLRYLMPGNRVPLFEISCRLPRDRTATFAE